jgi:hypothetical protein
LKLPGASLDSDNARRQCHVAAERGPAGTLRANWRQTVSTNTKLRGLVALSLALTLNTVTAHETWLAPAPDTDDGAAAWSMASGMRFGVGGTGIAAERIVRSRVLGSAGAVRPLEVADERDDATVLTADGMAGVQCAEVVLAPRFLTLPEEKIELYFDELGASSAMRTAWRASPNPELWRETYTKFAKSIVRRGTPDHDSRAAPGCWSRPLGHALEFMPDRDPTRLLAGDTLTVFVLLDGAPAGDQNVGIAHEGGDYAPLARSDDKGQVEFELARPGRYMVYGTRLERSNEPGEDWRSDFATLTFSVDARP